MPVTPISIDRGDLGVRIDRVLMRHLAHLPGVTRTRIQRLVDAGRVLINGRAVRRSSSRVAAGDRVAVELPERRARERPAAEPLALAIRYEDARLLIVDKPAGMVAHPAHGHRSGTLLNALLAHAADRWTPALVGRLDKDTSGLVLVAKDREAQAALQRLGERGGIEKDYLAIVRGRPPARGTIDRALARDPRDRRRMIVVDRGGAASVTRFERLRSVAVDAGRWVSLVRCRLVTGRTHQIRVHLASGGWPILDDPIYGDGHAGNRQALHAWRLAFAHPLERRDVEVVAPIPVEFEQRLAAAGLVAHSARARSLSTVPSAE